MSVSKKKPLKWIGIATLLVLLILSIPVVMLLLLDVNTYKSQISELVKEKTGRQLQINGKIGKTLFPWLGVDINDTRLGNPDGYAQQDFVSIGKLSVQVAFWPLLSGQAKIDTLHLQDLNLYLIRNKDGSSNWDFSAGDTGTAHAERKAAEAAAADTSASKDAVAKAPTKTAMNDPLAGIDLAGLNIDNARIVFDDRQSGAYYEIENLDMELSRFAANKPTDLKLSAGFKLKQPELSGSLELDSVLTLALAEQHYRAQIKQLKLNTQGNILPLSPLPLELSTNAEYEGQSGLLKVSGFTARSGGLNLKLDVQQTQTSPPRFEGKLDIPEVSLRDQLHRFKLSLPPDLPEQALKHFSLHTEFVADLNTLALSDIQIRLDQSQIKGKLNKLVYTPLALDWNLNIDRLILDDYLPPTPTQEAPAESTATSSAAAKPVATKPVPEADILPTELLRQLNLNGQLSIGKFQGMNLEMDAIKLGLHAQQGVLRAQPLELSLYGGKISGSAGINAKSDEPTLRLIQSIKNLNASELLKSAAKLDLVSAANVNANIDVDTRGNKLSAWKQHLHGKAQLDLKDGAINGVDLMSGLIEKYEKYAKKSFPREQLQNRTVFSELSGNFNIDQGVLTNNDLSVLSPEVKASGAGKVDLPKETLDFRILVTALKLPPWLSDSAKATLRDIQFPATIKGPFAAPQIDYDISGPLKDKAKRELNEKLDEKKAELKAKLENKKADLKAEQQAELQKKLDAEKERAKAKAREELEKKKEELKNRLKGLF